MRINSEQLPQRLQHGLSNLYVVFGDEPLLVLEASDQIRSEARRQGYIERELVIADSGFEWKSLSMHASNASLFGDKKLVELRIPSGKPGVEGGETLREYSSKLPPDTLTLISLPALDRQTLSSKWFEAIERSGVVVAINRIDRRRLPQWIQGRLAVQGQKADQQTLEFIADCVEGNLLAAYQEVQKLGLLFSLGSLTFDDVKQTVLDVARYDPFQLPEALLSGNAVRFTKILSGLQDEGVAPPLILWVLTEEVNVLLKIHYGLKTGQALASVLRDVRVHTSRHGLVTAAIKRLSIERLLASLRHAAAIDKLIKGLSQGNVWDELAQFGLRFCDKPVCATGV